MFLSSILSLSFSTSSSCYSSLLSESIKHFNMLLVEIFLIITKYLLSYESTYTSLFSIFINALTICSSGISYNSY